MKIISTLKQISNLKQINLGGKKDNLLSKLLILRSRVSLLKNKLICFLRYLSPLCRGLRSAAGLNGAKSFLPWREY
jgi:hypothetical protein